MLKKKYIIPILTMLTILLTVQITIATEYQPLGGWFYICGYLPSKESHYDHHDEFGGRIATSIEIANFFWSGPYTELKIEFWLGPPDDQNSILQFVDYYVAGSQGGFMPYAYYSLPGVNWIRIIYWKYWGKGEPPYVSYMGYCEWI